MSKKQPSTPRSRVKNSLRMLFLRSRERAAAIKSVHNTCVACGAKGSAAKGREVKIEVHHKDGIGNWNKVIDEVFRELLCAPENLECLCKECHGKRHDKHLCRSCKNNGTMCLDDVTGDKAITDCAKYRIK